MMTDTHYDLRALAQRWRDELEEDADARDDEFIGACAELCGDLCGEDTPDALESHGDNYDSTMIREDTFEDYARELAEDIGAMPEGNNWPAYCIDWEWAARELAMDYTSVRFMGTDYLIRA